MNIQYFKSAWGDIKNSPGWFGKLCLLALLNFIPIFGQIVTFAYLYGWAREIAWGTHEPLPRKIFANEDGKFWRRGWFVFVLGAVFTIVPQIIMSLGNYWQALGSVRAYAGASPNVMLGTLGGIFVIVGFIASLLCGVLAWIGNMRISIYDRLSAGFQLGKIWKMLRHDTMGVLKIFGMNLLFCLILGVLLSIVLSILVFLVVFVGVTGLMTAGYTPDSIRYMTEAQAFGMLMQFVASAGLVGFLAVIVGGFASLLVVVFIQMLVIRAVGYWTMQFEVPKWGGQDDPLPFESTGPVPQPQQPQQPPVYTPQQSQPYAGVQQPPEYAPQQSQPYAGTQQTGIGAQQTYAGAQQPNATAYQPYAGVQTPLSQQQSGAFSTTPSSQNMSAQAMSAAAPIALGVQEPAIDATAPAASEAQETAVDAIAPTALETQETAVDAITPTSEPKLPVDTGGESNAPLEASNQEASAEIPQIAEEDGKEEIAQFQDGPQNDSQNDQGAI